MRDWGFVAGVNDCIGAVREFIGGNKKIKALTAASHSKTICRKELRTEKKKSD